MGYVPFRLPRHGKTAAASAAFLAMFYEEGERSMVPSPTRPEFAVGQPVWYTATPGTHPMPAVVESVDVLRGRYLVRLGGAKTTLEAAAADLERRDPEGFGPVEGDPVWVDHGHYAEKATLMYARAGQAEVKVEGTGRMEVVSVRDVRLREPEGPVDFAKRYVKERYGVQEMSLAGGDEHAAFAEAVDEALVRSTRIDGPLMFASDGNPGSWALTSPEERMRVAESTILMGPAAKPESTARVLFEIPAGVDRRSYLGTVFKALAELHECRVLGMEIHDPEKAEEGEPSYLGFLGMMDD